MTKILFISISLKLLLRLEWKELKTKRKGGNRRKMRNKGSEREKYKEEKSKIVFKVYDAFKGN